MSQRRLSFWKKAEFFSPILCRILARKRPNEGGRVVPLSAQELAQLTGLTPYQVELISWQLDWTAVDLPTMEKFVRACGVDFEDEATYRRMMNYLRGRKTGDKRRPMQLTFLRRSGQWQNLYEPLIKRYLDHARASSEPN
jgi:hypothetical protein